MTFDAFGWFAATTSGLRSIPQILRLRSGPTSAGVSAASMAFTSLNGLAWIVWSASIENLPVLVSSTLTFFGFFEVARRARKSISKKEILLLGLVSASYIGTFFVAGPIGLGVLGSVGSAVQFLPQARKALRVSDRSGISPGTYILAASNEGAWLAYAALTNEPLLALPYLVRLPTSLLILLLVSNWHRHLRRRTRH